MTLDHLVVVRIYDGEREVEMPWKVVENFGDCNGYAVVKEGTNEIEGCHKTKSEAEAQQRALYASESQKFDDSIWNGAFFSNQNIEKGYN